MQLRALAVVILVSGSMVLGGWPNDGVGSEGIERQEGKHGSSNARSIEGLRGLRETTQRQHAQGHWASHRRPQRQTTSPMVQQQETSQAAQQQAAAEPGRKLRPRHARPVQQQSSPPLSAAPASSSRSDPGSAQRQRGRGSHQHQEESQSTKPTDRDEHGSSRPVMKSLVGRKRASGWMTQDPHARPSDEEIQKVLDNTRLEVARKEEDAARTGVKLAAQRVARDRVRITQLEKMLAHEDPGTYFGRKTWGKPENRIYNLVKSGETSWGQAQKHTDPAVRLLALQKARYLNGQLQALRQEQPVQEPNMEEAARESTWLQKLWAPHDAGTIIRKWREREAKNQ